MEVTNHANNTPYSEPLIDLDIVLPNPTPPQLHDITPEMRDQMDRMWQSVEKVGDDLCSILTLCDRAKLSTTGSQEEVFRRYWRHLVRLRFPEVPIPWDPNVDERKAGALPLTRTVARYEGYRIPPQPYSSLYTPNNTGPLLLTSNTSPTNQYHSSTPNPEFLSPDPNPELSRPDLNPSLLYPEDRVDLESPNRTPRPISSPSIESLSPAIEFEEPTHQPQQSHPRRFEKFMRKINGTNEHCEVERLFQKLTKISRLHRAKQIKAHAAKRTPSIRPPPAETSSCLAAFIESTPQNVQSRVPPTPAARLAFPCQCHTSEPDPVPNCLYPKILVNQSVQTENLSQVPTPLPRNRNKNHVKHPNASVRSESGRNSPDSGYRTPTPPHVHPKSPQARHPSPTPHIPPLMARLVSCPAPCPEVPLLRKFLFQNNRPPNVPMGNKDHGTFRSEGRVLEYIPPLIRNWPPRVRTAPNRPFHYPYTSPRVPYHPPPVYPANRPLPRIAQSHRTHSLTHNYPRKTTVTPRNSPLPPQQCSRPQNITNGQTQPTGSSQNSPSFQHPPRSPRSHRPHSISPQITPTLPSIPHSPKPKDVIAASNSVKPNQSKSSGRSSFCDPFDPLDLTV